MHPANLDVFSIVCLVTKTPNSNLSPLLQVPNNHIFHSSHDRISPGRINANSPACWRADNAKQRVGLKPLIALCHESARSMRCSTKSSSYANKPTNGEYPTKCYRGLRGFAWSRLGVANCSPDFYLELACGARGSLFCICWTFAAAAVEALFCPSLEYHGRSSRFDLPFATGDHCVSVL
jgi:hypothetical protein